MSIRQVKGLRFSSADISAKELTFQGVLGSAHYQFDTSTCEADFGLTHGVLYEFYFDAMGSPTSPVPHTPAGMHLPPKNTDSQAFLGRYFIPIGIMKTQLEGTDDLTGAAPTAKPAAGAGADKTDAAADGDNAKEPPPLYVYDVEELSLYCLAEAHDKISLQQRYPLRPVAEENARRFFECQIPDVPYGFSTGILPEKYYVRSGEMVYLSTLGEPAQIVGECFGCMWVRLGNGGRVTALGKATNEARLVTLYGLSDISNAPPPGTTPGSGQQQQPVITPRSVQTPRSSAAGPPYTLNKKTADGKPAVLCNCPMNLQVLAVCTADALRPFGVRPMTRLFFTLGVDAGKSATILGVRNGNLYIHMDGEQKCTCLRNATNAEELRERYTGSGGGGDSSAGIPPTASAKAMPKDLPKEVGSGTSASSSPLNIPKLSLGGIGSQLGSVFGGGGGSGQSPKPSPPASASRSLPAGGSSSPASGKAASSSPGRGFHFWTAHGCLQFDVSTDSCKVFSLRHGQTVRFSAGVDAGSIFHVIGVRGGNIWVVPDRGDFAVPLRHCSNAEEIQERVGPVLVGTTRLRSADPRGVPPLQQTMRSPDRRAGSPFGISPRNTTHEDEEGNPVEFGNPNNSAGRTSRELDLANSGGSGSSPGSMGNFASSSSMGTASASRDLPKISIQKSNTLGGNTAASGVYGTRDAADVNVANPQASMARFGTADSVLGAPRGLNAAASQSMTQHPSDLINKPAIQIHVPGGAGGGSRSSSSPASDPLKTAINRNTPMISPPGPVVTEAFKTDKMPATRIYLKAIALRALGVKREADMPTAFFRFFSHDAGANLSRALQEMPRFVTYWDGREKPMRGGRSFNEATTDMMVEALENLAQLKGEN